MNITRIQRLLCVIIIFAVCLVMVSCASPETSPVDELDDRNSNEKEETPIDVPSTDDPNEGPGEKQEENPTKEYSTTITQLNVSSSDCYSIARYGKGKYLLDDALKMIVYDPVKGTEKEVHFETPIVYAFDGDNIYYFRDYNRPLAEGESYYLHRFNIENSSDEVIYTVPDGYENLYKMRCVGRFLAWNEARLYDSDAIIMNVGGGLESLRIYTKIMDLDTGRIICDLENYTWTPYKDPGLTEDGLLTYLTRDNDEYTYHVVDITTSKELWKKEHMEYPLAVGETNGKYVAYSYNRVTSVAYEKPLYVESIESGETVYSSANIYSARFINNCLVTGFLGGFRITDLDTGKKVANNADFIELYDRKYIIAGWIEKAEDNQFIVYREDRERAPKDNPSARFAEDVFVVTLDEFD